MDNLGIKTTVYDVLGYAVPGAILLIGLYVLSNELSNLDLSQLAMLEISGSFAVVAFIASYVAGHVLSSVSSFVFENKPITALVAKFFDLDPSKYDEGAFRVFGRSYAECGPRAAMVYCQSKYPAVYDTAFAFLAIYGLSRNVAAAMLILFPLYIQKSCDLISISVYFIAFCFMVRNYYRFRVYYFHQIASALMIPEKAS